MNKRIVKLNSLLNMYNLLENKLRKYLMNILNNINKMVISIKY